ncbi:E3 ubiquitin-protein ligase ZSWIM2 [Centroberyx gerrardi]
MFRKTVWRNTASDAVSFHQDQALTMTAFLLKTYGPTSFLLKEEGQAQNFRVCLGDPHTCTCPAFHREMEPCKHICWVLMRKFRLPREHEYCFQKGLVERQISEILHGFHRSRTPRRESGRGVALKLPSLQGREAGSVCRKVIQAQDVCPICQEELLEKQLPVSYCRFGCGNNIHISCMKVWADHQELSGQDVTVKCPLCREAFGSLKLLREEVKNAARLYAAAETEKPDRHLGVLCHSCRVGPVTGTCFKCTVCRYYYLCEDCSKKGCHPEHPFVSRTKRRGKWCHVGEDLTDEERGASSQPANRSIAPDAEDPLPEHVLRRLPAVQVRPGSRLLDPGQQCRICLQSFALRQIARTLPCNHKFHADCVDGILRKSNSCPLDGFVVHCPATWSTSGRKAAPQLASCLSNARDKLPENNLKDLFIPGVLLLDKTAKVAPSHGTLNSEVQGDQSQIKQLRSPFPSGELGCNPNQEPRQPGKTRATDVLQS